MLVVLGVIAAVLLLAGAWVLVTFNRLTALRYACDDAWSLVDVQLQRRADLVPNLAEVVRGYAAHEQSVLEALATARAAANPLHEPTADHAAAETRLGAAIGETVGLREAYPALAASENFLQLQRALAEIETELAASREIYNGNVRAYRDLIGTVPSSLVARAFAFADRPMFRFELRGVTTA